MNKSIFRIEEYENIIALSELKSYLADFKDMKKTGFFNAFIISFCLSFIPLIVGYLLSISYGNIFYCIGILIGAPFLFILMILRWHHDGVNQAIYKRFHSIKKDSEEEWFKLLIYLTIQYENKTNKVLGLLNGASFWFLSVALSQLLAWYFYKDENTLLMMLISFFLFLILFYSFYFIKVLIPSYTERVYTTLQKAKRFEKLIKKRSSELKFNITTG